MLYGDKDSLDYFIEEIRHFKVPITYTKEGEKDVIDYMTCQVRMLPFGLYEIIFTEEAKDMMLTALSFHEKPPYNLEKEFGIMGLKVSPLKKLKEFLRIEDIPKFDTSKKAMIIQSNVSIIPIGVRYDSKMTDPYGPRQGWTHEAI